MSHTIAACGLNYHLDMGRTVDPNLAHLLESVFPRDRNPRFDTMSFRIHSGKVRVIGEIDLSHLCSLRFGFRLRFGA
jgi:hypothetical protein